MSYLADIKGVESSTLSGDTKKDWVIQMPLCPT